MMHPIRLIVCCGLLLAVSQLDAFEAPPLTPGEAAAAANDYQRYCALCHGADRQGGVNDHAPSLRSETLLRTGFPEFILFTIAYGRRGTPMGAYFEEVGGPMNNDELYRLTRWLKEQVDVESIDLPAEPIRGDLQRGQQVYTERCATCHGAEGEGVSAPAVGNPALLALASDAFMRYTIEHGRDGTEMIAWGEVLPAADIDAVTAFLRSRETHWELTKPVLQPPPKVGQYVLNPDAPAPEFQLKDGLYVMAEELNRALQEKRRIVVLDTRVTSMWQIAHIEGAVPIPYYHDGIAGLTEDLPTDGAWIVAYCECPRAAAESVTRKLRAAGFQNTAVLYEGIQGWISLGYPVFVGELTEPPQ
ncbi:c-type cytochrome [Pseudomonadota bacterium]|jgi:cytochrome c oxidase cbb3-type subunit 3|nr:c-type cytochrome [Xanthomonadales bacterium]